MDFKLKIDSLKTKIAGLSSRSDKNKISLGLDIGHFNSKVIELAIGEDSISVSKVGSNKSFNQLKTFDPENATKAECVANAQELFETLKLKPRYQ